MLMEVIIKNVKEDACKLGAKIISCLIHDKENTVLGLATGATPLLLYKELVRFHKQEGLSFKKVSTFNLDEYVGLSPKDPRSFNSYMSENLFKHIDISPEAINIPDGCAKDVLESCEAYERNIHNAGGIDLQVLGIGNDGHLAFNEPSSSLSSRTRIKTLTKVTRKANAESFGGEDNVPKHVITMGLGTIMETRSCLLLAFGKKKAEAVKAMIEGPITASCPASILQFHQHAIILLDSDAASLLTRREYYMEVYAGKPEWQKWE
ncbi:MAG: glucosamine-6-phosphate deaminase [Candidatus Riflebacteria bacterium]|nr:glucosamine-6-phosphate deaminase [Candidatus Riflebacteria bacterium]